MTQRNHSVAYQDGVDTLILTVLDGTITHRTQQCVANKGRAFRVLKRAVRDVLWTHRTEYCGMLSLQTTAADVPTVTAGVARALFSDGIINWGRIVSLVAYGTVLLQASKSTLWPECAYGIGVSIAAYITDNYMDWLVGTDGWDGFVDTFDRVHQRPWLSTQGKLFVFGVGLGLLSVLL
ncbi:induced myeloid leukemia cell differentiation protein Mcl-1 homolog [Oreochromis niloticus]|uniref:induced myeloid leukemia cell differentiation protein Mcl-1 homolog n=1 Tax=Oreochromis niloticus TaxID=8128 RepID=UPI000DF3728F|nr:induced myeloid leukemia cell differentiation protein Mcl-1 homolog [Oreochromis niloticus]